MLQKLVKTVLTPLKIDKIPKLKKYILKKLEKKWSPDVIAAK